MIKDETMLPTTALKKERDQNNHAEDDDEDMGFTEEASTIFGFRQHEALPVKNEPSEEWEEQCIQSESSVRSEETSQ